MPEPEGLLLWAYLVASPVEGAPWALGFFETFRIFAAGDVPSGTVKSTTSAEVFLSLTTCLSIGPTFCRLGARWDGKEIFDDGGGCLSS
jgi:hypothetical protein